LLKLRCGHFLLSRSADSADFVYSRILGKNSSPYSPLFISSKVFCLIGGGFALLTEWLATLATSLQEAGRRLTAVYPNILSKLCYNFLKTFGYTIAHYVRYYSGRVGLDLSFEEPSLLIGIFYRSIDAYPCQCTR